MQFRRLAVGVAVLATVIAAVTVAGCASDDPEILFEKGDYVRSLAAFTNRAQAGDEAAANYVGVQYYLGLGVDRDYERAASWFEKAALARHAGAQRNLGILYLRGLGVPQDRVRAYSWFYQSYTEGDPYAFKYLEFVADYITPNQSIDARRWVRNYLRDSGT